MEQEAEEMVQSDEEGVETWVVCALVGTTGCSLKMSGVITGVNATLTIAKPKPGKKTELTSQPWAIL